MKFTQTKTHTLYANISTEMKNENIKNKHATIH